MKFQHLNGLQNEIVRHVSYVEQLVTVCKRGLGQGNVFTSIRLSTGGGSLYVNSCKGGL